MYIIIEPLDDLDEKRRSVLHVLCEDLQQITLVVKVH